MSFDKEKCLHDIIVDELFNKKSLAALIFLIDSGRELEFRYNKQEYFVSCSSSKKYVSIWCDSIEQSFDSVYDLIEKALLSEKRFLYAWDKIEFETLF